MINECQKGKEQNEEGKRCKEKIRRAEQSRVQWDREDEKIKEQKREVKKEKIVERRQEE